MFEFTKEVNTCLLKIQQNDNKREQLGQLYDITSNHLRLVAARFLFDKNDIEDVIVEVFLRVNDYVSSFTRSENGYNWLCKITQNVAKNFNAKRLRTTKSEQKYSFDLDSEYHNKEIDNILFSFLLKDLSPTDQDILYRWLVLDETLEQIGKKLHMTKVAVHKRTKNICKIAEKFIN